jgi:hypothetical protein
MGSGLKQSVARYGALEVENWELESINHGCQSRFKLAGPRGLTGMDERPLQSRGFAQFKTSQIAVRVFADIDLCIPELE